MDWLFDEPAVVLVLVAIAAILLVIEVALPTLGIAGTLGFAAATGAVVAVLRDDMTWWPLVGPAAAVLVWAVLIAARTSSPVTEVVAAASFALGGVGFGLANDDVASIVVAVITTAVLALGFPRAQRAANRLLDRPSVVGMEGLVGRAATVDRWQGDVHVVLLDGSRWNAETDATVELRAGDEVEVVGFHGSTVAIRPAVVRPPAGPPLSPAS
ncbi:MAG: hypothetical protein H0U01_04790 [Acidimicrobiia bacterium]|nr:hypothetical protein [Acidimicrobiia bacterium]